MKPARFLMHGRIASLGLLLLIGCMEPTASTQDCTEEQTSDSQQNFDPTAAGIVQGRVVWDGEIPVAEAAVIRLVSSHSVIARDPVQCTMPHYPKVDAKKRGVEGAVVSLRGVDPARAKPWRHPPVRVEFHERQLQIVQGKTARAVGVVRKGDAIEIVNRDDEYHNLHFRGAAFGAAPLIGKDAVRRRTLEKAGVVDLRCGAGFYWLNAHLHVSDHPYVAVTDEHGRFTLDEAPTGRYELVCWMPNWRVLRHERDPETGIITRLIWAEPKEQVKPVEVRPGRTSEIVYRWSSARMDEGR